eukprot:SAG22_NODE_15438_length_349_cov_0.540000_1_plen_78_part_10
MRHRRLGRGRASAPAAAAAESRVITAMYIVNTVALEIDGKEATITGKSYRSDSRSRPPSMRSTTLPEARAGGGGGGGG